MFSYPRAATNRFDLTLQDGPNTHDTYIPRWTIRGNHSPPSLRTSELSHQHIISRALRESTKNKIYKNSILCSHSTCLRGGLEFRTSEAKWCISLLVPTTSYSQYVVSTIQTRSAGPTMDGT